MHVILHNERQRLRLTCLIFSTKHSDSSRRHMIRSKASGFEILVDGWRNHTR